MTVAIVVGCVSLVAVAGVGIVSLGRSSQAEKCEEAGPQLVNNNNINIAAGRYSSTGELLHAHQYDM
jgi:hypothetical protein